MKIHYPMKEVISICYSATLQNFGYLLKISWLWICVLVLFNLSQNLISNKLLTLVIDLVINNIVTSFVVASIAVAIHRKILLNEEFSGYFYLRSDSLVWKYFLVVAAMTIAAHFMAAIIIFTAIIFKLSVSTLKMLLSSLAFVALIFLTRLSVGLPAKALGWSGFPVIMILDKTAHNIIRLVLTYFACIFPIIFFTLILFMAAPFIILKVLFLFLGCLLCISNVCGFMSYSFAFFFEDELKNTKPLPSH